MTPEVIPKYTLEEKRSRSWHYHGYRTLSVWMASAPEDFCLFRRYSTVTTRTLLYLQHQIAKIEAKLDEIDERSMKEELGHSYLDNLDYDPFSDRTKLLAEIGPLLQKYCRSISMLLLAVAAC